LNDATVDFVIEISAKIGRKRSVLQQLCMDKSFFSWKIIPSFALQIIAFCIDSNFTIFEIPKTDLFKN
jgi:hypothetical protein